MRRSKGNRNGSVPPNSTVSVEVEVVRVRNKKPVKVLIICISNFLPFTLIVQDIVHTHCNSGHCSHSLQFRTLLTLIATQDIVYTDCNSGHRHWAGILGEVGCGHCAPSKWTSINIQISNVTYQMSQIRNTKPYY